jgi:hypothetical protein
MKKWKIALIIVLLLVVGGAGTAYYFFELKEYETEDLAIKEITETEYTITLPTDDEDEEEVEVDDENSTETTGTDTNSDTNSQTQSSNGTSDKGTTNQPSTETSKTTPNPTESKPKKKDITVASIKTKYEPTFVDLESQANSKIDSLIGRAFTEFQEKKANGESVSFGYFYQKYNSAAKELEKRTDAAFEIVYDALEGELKKHGFSPSHAKEFKEAYDTAKSERRSALLKKAMEQL